MTAKAAEELTALFSFNIPQRWSIAHLYQAILSGEEHVKDIAFLTTLAGYVHWKLTGRPSSAGRRGRARSARRAADSAQRSKSFFPFCSVTSATWSIVMPLISATRAAMNGRLRESLRLPRFGTGAR